MTSHEIGQTDDRYSYQSRTEQDRETNGRYNGQSRSRTDRQMTGTVTFQELSRTDRQMAGTVTIDHVAGPDTGQTDRHVSGPAADQMPVVHRSPGQTH